MTKITDTFTHVSNLIGKYRTATTAPQNVGPAGIAAGDVYIDDDQRSFHIYNGTNWMGIVMTTTSTSTSTTTSSSTSTSTTA